MATPSVLTVPSMYGDGILYSGPTVFGNNVVVNGNFATNSDWTLTASANIANGKLNVSAGAFDFFATQVALTNGSSYKISVEVVVTSGSVLLYTGAQFATITVSGVYNYYVVADSTQIRFRSSGSGFVGTIDNVSAKQITQGSDFDFTRGTTGTRINEDGYIEDVPYNFIKNSQEITGAGSWVIQGGVTVTNNYAAAPDGSMTADRLVGNGTSGVFQQVTDIDGVIARSVYLKSITGNVNVVLKDPTLTQTQKTLNLTESWQRYDLIEDNLSPTSTQGLWIDDIPTSGILMWGSQIVKGDKVKDYLPTTDRLNLPRLNYPTYGGCPSILMEPQRTNVVDYSEDIDSNSGLSDVGSSIIIDSNIVSPAGLKSVSLLKEDSSNGSHFTFKDWSLTNPSTNTISIFAKSNGGRNLRFGDGGVGWSSGFTANFDLTTGISDTGLMEYYGNGWYRCSVQGTVNAATSRLIIYITDGTTTSYQGDNTSGVYLYGFQIEEGSYATSLIHTSGSSETRNEDIAADAGLGTTDTFNDSEGVFYAEIRSDDPEPTATYTSINDGTGGQNQVRIGYLVGSLYSQIRVAGSAFYALNIPEADVTQNNKVAVRYKAEDHAVFLNGFKLSTDTSNTIFAAGTLDRVNFSAYGTSGEFRGKNKALAVYKTALTDTELANLTSYNNHDLFIPYRSRMQMIGADQELQCTEHDITRFL